MTPEELPQLAAARTGYIMDALTEGIILHDPEQIIEESKKTLKRDLRERGVTKKEARLDLANKSGRNNQAIAPQKTPPKKTGTTTSQREKTPKNNHDKEQSKLLTPPAKSKTP
ncbi:MAG: hypothetical protein Q6352_008875 [Candidatus Freyrarchaeum guaymaensis]